MSDFYSNKKKQTEDVFIEKEKQSQQNQQEVFATFAQEQFKQAEEFQPKDKLYNPLEQKQISEASSRHKSKSSKNKKAKEKSLSMQKESLQYLHAEANVIENAINVLHSKTIFIHEKAVVKDLTEALDLVKMLDVDLSTVITPKKYVNTEYDPHTLQQVFEKKAENESYFIGLIENKLNLARAKLVNSKTGSKRVTTIKKALDDTAKSFSKRRSQLPMAIRNKCDALIDGNSVPFTLGDVWADTNTEMMFGNETIISSSNNGAISDVTRLKKGGRTYFFKETSHAEDGGLETLNNAIKDRIDGEFAEAITTVFTRIDNFLKLKQKNNDAGPNIYNECVQAFFNMTTVPTVEKKKSEIKSDEKNFESGEKSEIKPVEKNFVLCEKLLSEVGFSLKDFLRSNNDTKENATPEGYDKEKLKWWHEFWANLRPILDRIDSGFYSEKSLKLSHADNLQARNFASENMAQLLGLKNIIIHNTEASLEVTHTIKTVDHQGNITPKQVTVIKKGFVMDGANGSAGDDMINKFIEAFTAAHPGLKEKSEGKTKIDISNQIECTPEAFRQLINLNIMDEITQQVDRHNNNLFFNYSIKDNKLIIEGAKGIDNDLSFGNVEWDECPARTSVLNEAHTTYMPNFIDEDLYNTIHIIASNDDILSTTLEGLLEENATNATNATNAINALKSRFKTIIELIDNKKVEVENEGKKFLLQKNDVASWKAAMEESRNNVKLTIGSIVYDTNNRLNNPEPERGSIQK